MGSQRSALPAHHRCPARRKSTSSSPLPRSPMRGRGISPLAGSPPVANGGGGGGEWLKHPISLPMFLRMVEAAGLLRRHGEVRPRVHLPISRASPPPLARTCRSSRSHTPRISRASPAVERLPHSRTSCLVTCVTCGRRAAPAQSDLLCAPLHPLLLRPRGESEVTSYTLHVTSYTLRVTGASRRAESSFHRRR